MENTKMNEIAKYSYLLDQDNLIIENKIFIDIMWYIAKDKFTTPDKNGKPVLRTKSYVIRNAAVMFQQIFYWHLQYLKKDKKTTYQYKGKNVIKMDLEDWWENCRLTDKEITSANKFLIDTELVKIVKMRIKEKDKEIYKPSSCYLINYDVLEKYMNNVIDINKFMYVEKVKKIKIKKVKYITKKLSTKLSTKKGVNPVTVETLKIKGSNSVHNDLSTLSTNKNIINIDKTCPVDSVTGSTIENSVTGSTIENSVTGLANKSNTSYTNTSYTNTSEKGKRISSSPLSKDDLFNFIKSKTTEVGFNTWFKSGIEKLDIKENTLEIEVINDFTKEILQTRYLDLIKTSVSELSNKEYQIVFI